MKKLSIEKKNELLEIEFKNLLKSKCADSDDLIDSSFVSQKDWMWCRVQYLGIFAIMDLSKFYRRGLRVLILPADKYVEVSLTKY